MIRTYILDNSDPTQSPQTKCKIRGGLRYIIHSVNENKDDLCAFVMISDRGIYSERTYPFNTGRTLATELRKIDLTQNKNGNHYYFYDLIRWEKEVECHIVDLERYYLPKQNPFTWYPSMTSASSIWGSTTITYNNTYNTEPRQRIFVKTSNILHLPQDQNSFHQVIYI